MIDLRDYLADVEYPCGRDELLRRAAAHGAGDNVLGRIGTLPERDYDGIDAVNELLGQDLSPDRDASSTEGRK